MGCYVTAPLYHWEAVNLGRGGGWVPMSTGESPAPPGVIKMPTTLVLELMTRYRGRYALQCDVSCDAFASPAAGNMPGFEAVPLVNAAATWDAEQRIVYVSVVNCCVDEPMRVRLDGLEPIETIEMHIVSGASPLVTNTFDAPDAIQIKHEQVKADRVTLPRHSYAMLVLQL